MNLFSEGTRTGRVLIRVTVFGLLPLVTGQVLRAQQPAEQGRVSAVDSTVKVGPDRPVAIGTRAVAVVEPHLAADPNEPNHLVAGVILVTKLGDPRDPNA
jgi:hypothetical protein